MTVLEYQPRVKRMTSQLHRVSEALCCGTDSPVSPVSSQSSGAASADPFVSRESPKERQAMIGAEIHPVQG